MPKVKVTGSRVTIHIGDWWKKYKEGKLKGAEFRVHDVGRRGYSQRIAIKYKGFWHTYAWSFSKDQVSIKGRRILCKDRKAFEILKQHKDLGDLKGWKVCYIGTLVEVCY